MKYFAVVFAAIVALSVATPVEVEERQGDIINMIINMIKGFICDADLPVRIFSNRRKPPKIPNNAVFCDFSLF